MPISKKQKSELKQIITSKSKDKFYKLQQYIAALPSNTPDDVRALSEIVSGIFVEYLNIAKPRGPVRKSFIGMLQRALSRNTRISEFIKHLNDSVNGTQDAGYFKFADALIVDLIIAAVTSRAWHQATSIVSAYNRSQVLNDERLNSIAISPEDLNLLDAVTFINLLPDSAVARSAALHKLSDYKIHLRKLMKNPEVQKFLANFERAQNIIQLGHIWSLKGRSEGVNLSGSNEEIQKQQLSDFIRDQQANHRHEREAQIQSQLPDVPLAIIQEILRRSDEQALILSAYEFHEGLDKRKFLASPNKPIIDILTVGAEEGMSDDHAMAFAFWGDMFFLFERSGSLENNGVSVFRINDILRSNLFNIAAHHSFASIIRNQLQQAIDKGEAQLVFSVPMKPQIAGNCTWVATKGAYWISAYISALQVISEQALPVEQQQLLARQFATVCYKYLSNQKRVDVAVDYLKQPNTDPNVLAQIAGKIFTYTWQNRGMGALLSSFPDSVQQKAEAEALQALKYAIQTLNVVDVKKLALPVFADSDKLKSYALFQTAIAVAGELIGRSTQEFKPVLDILNLLIERQLTYVDLGDDYLSPQDYFEELISRAKNVNTENRDSVSAILKSVKSVDNLIYAIVSCDAGMVKCLCDSMSNSSDKSSKIDLYPFEVALKLALTKHDEPEEIFARRLEIIELLVAANITSMNSSESDLVDSIHDEFKDDLSFESRKQRVLDIINQLDSTTPKLAM